MDQVASANGRLLGTALAGMLQATLILGRNVASWAFGQHRNTSITVLAVFALTLACAMRNGCMSYMTDASNLAAQAGSLAKAGVIAWGVYQLQQAAGLYPTMPRVARPTAITRPAGTLNGPLRPFWETCMLGAVVHGLADLTSGAFGYQNNATTNAGLAANAMYNVATCGGGGGSSGGSGGGNSATFQKNSEKVVYPRGVGASTGPVPEGYVSLSRWVNAQEAQLWMQNGGTSIPGGIGAGGRVYVTIAGAPKPGGTGPIRIDFYAQQRVLQIGGNVKWFYIMQPTGNIPIYNVAIYYPK